MEGGAAGQLRALGKDALSGILGRILRGDVGYLQVFLALGLIWTVFQLANDRFLTATNLTNLLLQVTAIRDKPPGHTPFNEADACRPTKPPARFARDPLVRGSFRIDSEGGRCSTPPVESRHQKA